MCYHRLRYFESYQRVSVDSILEVPRLSDGLSRKKTQNLKSVYTCIALLGYLRKNFKNLLLKGALSGLRQFLATERLLNMIENVFYFISKALFVLKIFKLLS